MNVVCPHCGTVNRLPEERLADGPICGQCKEGLLPDHPVELTADNFEHFIANSELPVVVDFWATWCGPCRVMAPQFVEAAGQMAGRAVFAKVDTDAAQDIANRLAIRSIPTLAIFDRGLERTRQMGARPASEIVRWVEQEIG